MVTMIISTFPFSMIVRITIVITIVSSMIMIFLCTPGTAKLLAGIDLVHDRNKHPGLATTPGHCGGKTAPPTP